MKRAGVLVVAAAFALALPAVTRADTLSLQVRDEGGVGDWAYGGTGTSGTYADVQTNDTDTSYAVATGSNDDHAWVVDPSSGQSGTITNVTVHAFLKGNERIKLAVNGSFMATGFDMTGTYTEYTNSWATNPAGGAWTWGDIDTLQVGVRSQNNGQWAGDVRCTHIWVVVEYTPPAGADTLQTSNPGAAETSDPSQGQSGIVMQRFQVDSDSTGDGQVELTSLTLTDAGTAVTGDIDTVRVYIDTDTIFAGSTEIGNAAFSTDPITVTLGAGDRTVTNGTPKYIFVVYDLNAGATIGNTIRSQVTAVGVAGPDNGVTGLAYNSNLLTIQGPSPDTLQTSSPAAVETADPSQGQSGIVMQRFQVDSDTAGNNQVELTSLTLEDRGTAVTGDIDTVRVHIDTDTIFAGSTEIGNATFTTDPVTVTLNLATAGDRTVTNGTSKYIFVVYDLNAAATVGSTIQSRVTDVGVAGPDNGVTGLAYNSNLLTVQAATANATTVVSSSATVSSCDQITVTSIFSGDADGDGTTLVEVEVPPGSDTYAVSCATLSGPSPRQCLVTQGLTPGGTHKVRVTFSDPDGVTGTAVVVITPDAVPTCTGVDDVAPTVLFLAPRRDAVLGGLDRVKVQVFDADDATPVVQWSVDGGGLSAATVNPAYDCGTSCGVYEFDLDTTGLANGGHYMTVRVTDANGNVAALSRGFRVGNLAGKPRGSGHLLRRTAGSQVCIDCHNLPSHSSQSTSTQYGNWAMGCFDCHTPHRTRNIYLVREALSTPNSGVLTIQFQVDADATLGYLGARSGPNNIPHDDGICEACHTRTKYHRNDTSGSDDHGHNVGSGQSCIECHAHASGFSGAGGGGCLACHGDAGGSGTTGPRSRRPVNPDFGLQSHHVGNGGAMGGALTDFDCVVCHAEGTVNAGATETVSPWHNNGVIDLKDADTAAIYSYDKGAVTASAGAAPAGWSSADPVWRDQSRLALDPFCLSCHDGNGAVGSFNANDGGGSASNPFADGTITNNYDQLDRTQVVDIKSKVSGSPPLEGQFSRHAIRDQSASVYTTYTGLGGSYRSMYEGDTTAGESLFTSMGTAESPLWNDTSVMGCADCHTTDGANGATGNAHGSDSEYLLKDASGGAAEGTLAALSYVCYRCHKVGRYQPPNAPLGNHTSNSGDWVDTTGAIGSARNASKGEGNVFAMACTNCHGGTGFGSIHGTSEALGTGEDGTAGTRNAYRFMNGAGLRFYDPGTWSGTSATCFTLSSATKPDTFGDCAQHNKGTSWTRPLQRPLAY